MRTPLPGVSRRTRSGDGEFLLAGMEIGTGSWNEGQSFPFRHCAVPLCEGIYSRHSRSTIRAEGDGFPPPRILRHGSCTVRLFVKSVLLLFAVVGLCLCVTQAATLIPTGGASPAVKASASAPTAALTTLPTIPGLPPDAPISTPVAKTATQAAQATTSPAVRETTSRPLTTAPTMAAPSTNAGTPRSTTTVTTTASTPPITTGPKTEASTPTYLQDPTGPWPTEALNAAPSTPWPIVTAYESVYPTEERTPDIDPGMTPYTGPTQIVSPEPTPSWEMPAETSNLTPIDLPGTVPYFTADAVQSPPFELPPGAYEVDLFPSSTETMAPLPSSGPEDAAGSPSLPRWLNYLFFIFLGIAGVAAVALVGSRLGSRPPAGLRDRYGAMPSPPPGARGAGLLQPGAGETTAEQQALVDLIAGFSPQSMHVERLGRHLLRFERAAQAQDPSARLGRLITTSAVPSAPVPPAAAAWARAHGFRVIAADGHGMALVMPALSSGLRSILGILPVGEMVDGGSPVPMPVLPPESELLSRPHARGGAVPHVGQPAGNP